MRCYRMIQETASVELGAANPPGTRANRRSEACRCSFVTHLLEYAMRGFLTSTATFHYMRHPEDNRPVITGIGAMTCLGKSFDVFWDNLKNGVSGIRPMSLIDPTPFPCKVSGEVQDFNPSEGDLIHRREARRMGRFSQLAVHAADQAIKDADLDLDVEDRDRVGILLGCGAGGLPETDQQSEVKNRRGALRVSPFYVPIMLVNMCSANVSRVFGIYGYTNTCVTACAASTQAIGEAAEVIRRGGAEVILTGGTEAGICELGMGGFSTIHALHHARLPSGRSFNAVRYRSRRLCSL